ncbi:MAG: hydrogenobyrinic acid a,c-diamide synthase (glutamine-hydrolyzing) [Deltaproteobacteria bacterium]|nr:hydrogenobyrinic acid a,c-diamide synthase (glutamine-hydrolyzing) [Deltaproteobacteria bacterium]
MNSPGVVIAAVRGGAGKTILSIGIIAALCKRGYAVAPFKKGPDYIDAGWLALAAGRPCYNLDTYLIDKDTILESYHRSAQNADLAVIEGNRGLYDSIDRKSKTSTAELAKWLDLPVILCIDGTKTTRTMAAVVLGCINFDPEVKIRGVILNRVAGKRHQNNLKDCIEHYCNIPVLGAVPKLKEQRFPERHMGLVPTPEHDWAMDSIQSISEIASTYLDLGAIENIAHAATGQQGRPAKERSSIEVTTKVSGVLNSDEVERGPRVGIIRDSAFQFYYPENLEALNRAGAELVFTSPLEDETLPDVNALYIGGGFPETHARELAESKAYREQIRSLVEKGLPVYAECGGLMYLGAALLLNEKAYPMVNVFPIVFDFHRKPQGHGYTIVKVTGQNPFYPVGMQIKGHEFHYSKAVEFKGDKNSLAFSMQRGVGLIDGKDGICHKNVLATYTHIHALGTSAWAGALVKKAQAFRDKSDSLNST